MDTQIAEPTALAPARMMQVTAALRAIGFDERHCGDRLGRLNSLPDFAGRKVAKPYLRSSSDPLDLAIALFLFNEEVPLCKLHELFDESQLDALEAMSLVNIINDDSAFSPLNLLPCCGSYIATDRMSAPAQSGFIKTKRSFPVTNPVMWLYPESYVLAGYVDRTSRLHAALDLGTGSGIHALMASRHCDHVIGVDINPRALAFSRFNQQLNGCGNVEYFMGDLYSAVAGRRFDLILANPPYNPTPYVSAGTNFWSGGTSGEDILSRVLRGIDEHLTERGICHIITLLCYSKSDPSFREKLDFWLVGGVDRYDVLAQVLPNDAYFMDVVSDEHQSFLRENFARFEFGVISVRRSRGSTGFYYHGPPHVMPPFFDENVRFRGPVGHATFDACRDRAAA